MPNRLSPQWALLQWPMRGPLLGTLLSRAVSIVGGLQAALVLGSFVGQGLVGSLRFACA